MNPNRADEARLRRAIRWLAVAFAAATLLAALGASLGFYFQAQRSHVEIEALLGAETFGQLLRADPEGWLADGARLARAAESVHRSENEGLVEILAPDGTPLYAWGKGGAPFHVSATAPILDGGWPVARVRVSEFPHELGWMVAAGLLLGGFLAAGVILMLWVVPMRAMNAAFGKAEDYRVDLEARVNELELAKDMLERQGAELREAADSLYHAREQERAASMAKSDFLANMSHELRTPLNSIIGFSEVMTLESFGPLENARYREYVQHIHESGSHLLALINDMLDLAKVEAGKLELDEHLVDFAVALQGCRDMLRHRLDSGGLRYVALLPDGLPLLNADERKLRQILFNLLSNAIKYTPQGGRVTVKAWIDDAGQFRFSVADNGVGMAPEDIPRALEPFGQATNSMVTGERGTGLGLPLTRDLVALHGGRIQLDSALGKGTRATVTFPADRVLPLPSRSAG